MISVELHRSLRPTARESHRRALLTLPRLFRVVDGGGRFVVAEWDADVAAERVIRVGSRRAASDSAEIADSPVWRDTVVDDLVRRISPARGRIEGVRVLGFVAAEDGGRWVAQRMDEALELLGRLLPDSPVPTWTWSTDGDAVTCAWGDGPLRAAGVVCTGARAPMFDVLLAGRELSASMTVATGTTAQSSSFRLAQGGSVAVSAAGYSSARRELWLSIAREQGIEMTPTEDGSR